MKDDDARIQRFSRTHEGMHHEVAVRPGTIRQSITWSVGGAEVATGRTADERITLSHSDAGAVRIQLTKLGKAKRATLYTGEDADGHALIGIGGVELDPEPGSWAARRLERAEASPTRHTLISATLAVLGVVAPIIGFAVLVWIWRRIPKPDVDAPKIPLPDLPNIPWPSIPWPDVPWPDVDVPDWLGYAKYVVPVVIAVAIARAEIRKERVRRVEREARSDERDEH